jgi:hypothetical protein
MKKNTAIAGLFLIGLLGLPACNSGKRSAVSDPDPLPAIQLPTSSQQTDLYLFKSWKFEKPGPLSASFLYLSGGIDNVDKGSTDWGTTDSRKFRMIGDYAGELRISYDNGITDTIPLVYGYTLWFKHGWREGKEPFASDQHARDILDSTLYLNHLYNDKDDYVLRIRLRNAALTRMDYFDNRLKDGYAMLLKFGVSGLKTGQVIPDSVSVFPAGEKDSLFYSSHTVDTVNTYPLGVKYNLRRLMGLLYSFNADFEGVTNVDIPKEYQGPSIVFSGGSEANIISNVFYHNLRDQISRVDTSGIVHESAWKSPSWFYDGFGTWTNAIGTGNNGSYFDCYYTRNKTIMLLPDLNYIAEANRALALLDKQLMYFPENYPALQLAGKKIPGHWTVIANKPLVYSRVLTGVGWPTQYTKEKFGSHYTDYGNPETDGHGHSMMSHWKTWQNSGRNKQWVTDRWIYLKEAADFLLWSLDHPDLSFSRYGLLYAESEAGMNDYTLYCNFPCYLGLLMYSEMADVAGAKEDAVKWRDAAGKMKVSMNSYFAENDSMYGKTWKKVGFFHENVLMTLKEYAGFDLEGKLPGEWMERSRNTYEKNKAGKPDYIAPAGLGYDHDILLQTAMLLDKMDDVNRWMTNLAHLCYSPRLPQPFIVPECASVDVNRGIFRRQGDVGNGYQQAETVNSIVLCGGVDDNTPGRLNIMPRLPEKWDMKISDYPAIVYVNGVSHTAYFDLNVTYPVGGKQTCTLKVISGGNLENVHFRLGPFPADTKSITIGINGKKKAYPCIVSGDRSWAWLVIPEIKEGSDITLQTHK